MEIIPVSYPHSGDAGPQEVTHLSVAQLQESIADTQGQEQGGGGIGTAAAESLPPCPCGRDKTRRFQQLMDWLTQTDAKMEFLNFVEYERKTVRQLT